jgi:hypothetical protein
MTGSTKGMVWSEDKAMRRPRMRLQMKLFAATVLALALSAPAYALTIVINPDDAVLTGNQTSQAQINAIVLPLIAPATELYKQNVGGAETGVLAGSYTTVFSNTVTAPSDATITYVAGMGFVGSTAWALVKDGNSSPAWYLFDLTALGWNGTDTLEFLGFWPDQGAISHVTLYGGSVIPDGGSVAILLGLGLMGLAGVRRFIK